MDMIKDIRYTELRFTVEMLEDSILPRFKSSAIRGGIGNMLLDEYCIRENYRKQNEECNNCDFVDECIVQRILYAKMDIEPKFMSAGNSIGYIVECDDTRELFESGDELRFKLILFGKNIFYLSQYLSAVYRLGQAGLGKEKTKYDVVSVCNVFNKPILQDNNIYKDRYVILTVDDYVEYRKKKLVENFDELDDINTIRIKMITPISIKKQGEYLKSFDVKDFMDNLYRRIYMMNCFEGIEKELSRLELDDYYPKLLQEESRYVEIPRYSGRKNQKIYLKGLYGSMTIDLSSVREKTGANINKMLEDLFIGELLHVGSNTSFGFGKYVIELL